LEGSVVSELRHLNEALNRYRDGRGPQLEPSTEWVSVDEDAPCPRCGGISLCRVSADGRYVHCFLVPSRWPMADGGWLHPVNAPPQRKRPQRRRAAPEAAPATDEP
jgi:hypothetical protein